MKVRVKTGLLKGVLQWAPRLLFATAILLLGYCGFAMADSWIFQQRESRVLQRLLEDGHQASPGSLRLSSSTATPGPPDIAAGGLIGRIEIPRLGLTAIIIEGTSATTLRRAVGHISGTGLPGRPGNVGISGHRDTFFRPLRNIRQNDIITLTTLGGEYRYRVVSTKVVSPYDVAVLDSSANEILTLITCYPFYFVGSAPDRFMVRAERIENAL
jgi:sortase A